MVTAKTSVHFKSSDHMHAQVFLFNMTSVALTDTLQSSVPMKPVFSLTFEDELFRNKTRCQNRSLSDGIHFDSCVYSLHFAQAPNCSVQTELVAGSTPHSYR